MEQDVVGRDVVYCGRGKKQTLVTLPLHDRNGDAIAAVRFVLQPYAGQTEQAALARAMPILRELETRVRSARDLMSISWRGPPLLATTISMMTAVHADGY